MALVIGKGIGPPAACKRKNDERGNSGRYRAVIGCGEKISGTAMYSSFMSERECHMRIRPSLSCYKRKFSCFFREKCPGMDRQRICGNRKKRRTDRLFLLLCQRG